MPSQTSLTTAADRGHGTAANGPFSITINRRPLPFRDPLPTARQMLDAAGFTPADECILIQLLPEGARSVALDETVDLRARGTETFWAFRSDRLFRFTVAGRGFEWGAPAIAEPMLREIARVKEDEILVLERRNEPDRELGAGDEIRLGETGTEHLRIEPRLVEVFFKDLPYRIPRGTYTTEELMAQFPIEPGYLLNLQTPEGELVTLKPGQKTPVKAGMRFYSQVPGGAAS